MAESPPIAPINAADVKAQITAAEKALAPHRATALRILLAKVQAAKLGDIAADLMAARDVTSHDKDLFVFKLHAEILASTEKMLTDAIAAADALSAA